MDPPVRTVAPTAPHTHTVVFLHGRGDTAHEFLSSLSHSRDSRGRTLPAAFPSFRWVFPQARERACAAFPGPAVAQWFDVWNTRDFSEREELQAVGLRESVAGVRRLLEREAAALGGRWDCLVLAGISQGAATSVHALLNLNLNLNLDAAAAARQGEAPRLGAFLGFSCRMPFPGRTLAATRGVLGFEDAPDGDGVVRNTPVLLEHCANDEVVPVEGGRGLRDALRGFGAQVEWREYPQGGHWFNSPAGIDDAVQFLSSVLPAPGPGTNAAPQALVSSDAMDLS